MRDGYDILIDVGVLMLRFWPLEQCLVSQYGETSWNTFSVPYGTSKCHFLCQYFVTPSIVLQEKSRHNVIIFCWCILKLGLVGDQDVVARIILKIIYTNKVCGLIHIVVTL
jgi:hypothetical protein